MAEPRTCPGPPGGEAQVGRKWINGEAVAEGSVYRQADDYDRRMPYDPSAFPPFAVTVDLVVLTVRRHSLCALAVRRGEPPFQGRWALPGGFVRDGEDLAQAAARELAEETGLCVHDPAAPSQDNGAHLEQLATYGDPERDPRMRVVSVAHLALAPDLPAPRAGGDASNARWAPVEELLEQSGYGRAGEAVAPLAFDHAQILADGVERARSKIEYSSLATAFCPPEFTVGELRRVYEAVWSVALDPRNFHRKVTGTPGFLVPPAARPPARAAVPPSSSARAGRPSSTRRCSVPRYDAGPSRCPKNRISRAILLRVIQAFGLTSNPRKELPPAVDDVSFEARAGRVTALLGASGAGKTTALRLMLGLQRGRGLTYFRGRPLHRIAHPSREVGVLLGDVPGHPARTVRGHLRMLCAAAGVPVRRADEVLESVGLLGLRDERLGSLSRGMDRASDWPAHWSPTRTPWSSTIPPAPSPPTMPEDCTERCARTPHRAARCCSARRIPRRPRAAPTTSSRSSGAGSSPTRRRRSSPAPGCAPASPYAARTPPGSRPW